VFRVREFFVARGRIGVGKSAQSFSERTAFRKGRFKTHEQTLPSLYGEKTNSESSYKALIVTQHRVKGGSGLEGVRRGGALDRGSCINQGGKRWR